MTASVYRKINAGFFLLAFLSLISSLQASQETNTVPAAGETVITNMTQFWPVTSDPERRNQLQRARMELLIYYCDTNWNVYWGESDGASTFLPFRGLPRQLMAGEKILVDGWVLPVNQEFQWDRTSVRVLSESNPMDPIPAAGKLANMDELKAKFVGVEALVDSVQSVTPVMAKLNLLADNINVDAFVHLDKPAGTWPDLTGKIVKIQGVYSATLDPFGKISNLTLWACGLDSVETIGSLADDPRFSIPVVTAEDFAAGDSQTPIRVRGSVRSQQPGEAVTIWDATGQIRILAKQRQPLQLGDRIEAIGCPSFQGIDRVLQAGLFRVVTNHEAGDFDTATNAIKLRLADQVRALDQESLAQHPPASLEGEVTLVNTRSNFMYVQDSSGGIRVMQTRLQNGRRIQPGMLINVDGIAAMGEYAPVITNAMARQAGSMTLPDPPLESFEQALTGTEDGDWIQMRGYVRKATQTATGLELQLVAPGGEFVAHVPRADAVDAPQGSVILVRGVCVAAANSRRQLTGIEIWSTTAGSVQTEQLAPDDLFAQPQRSLASLRQFNLFNTLNKRVHTSGTVTLQVPGRYVYLQDGDNSICALSDQTDPLQPGDRVEVVGFSGNDHGNFLLREAVYRHIATGPDPAPVNLDALGKVYEDLDGLLVRTEGSLLEVVKESKETRLVIQSDGHIFEAKLDEPMLSAKSALAPDSVVAVTGVYRIQRDESGKPLSFVLNFRNLADVRVLAPPPWWTIRRVLFLLTGGLPLILFVLFWTVQTRRKNRLLQRAQVELKNAHDKLEERVEERTGELNEEVEARKRALDRLSEAQQRLILASRQAGMAEVATGILHNVGNILNSVNVSATIISDSLQRLRIGKFTKAVELLGEHGSNLPVFLTEDPRGRALPGYLQQLAGSMAQTEQTLYSEVKSLSKQIDHVKSVVAWQQGYARSSGFYESLNLVELMEDAIQINQGGYERHAIEVVREYGSLPPITSDRHKILQILINLLANAKQALAASKAASKRVVLRIYARDDGQVCFEVSDTGVGIPPENLERIFSLGFTTKINGHGFGLHSGANSAKEMGGRLFATSKGTGCGSTFILELPVAAKTELPAPVKAESMVASV